MVDKNPVRTRQNSAPYAFSIEEIRSTFQGSVIAPGGDGYDAARLAFYGGIDKHPAVILRPRNTSLASPLPGGRLRPVPGGCHHPAGDDAR